MFEARVERRRCKNSLIYRSRDPKSGLLRAIERVLLNLELRHILRILGLSPSRYHAWRSAHDRTRFRCSRPAVAALHPNRSSVFRRSSSIVRHAHLPTFGNTSASSHSARRTLAAIPGFTPAPTRRWYSNTNARDQENRRDLRRSDGPCLRPRENQEVVGRVGYRNVEKPLLPRVTLHVHRPSGEQTRSEHAVAAMVSRVGVELDVENPAREELADVPEQRGWTDPLCDLAIDDRGDPHGHSHDRTPFHLRTEDLTPRPNTLAGVFYATRCEHLFRSRRG